MNIVDNLMGNFIGESELNYDENGNVILNKLFIHDENKVGGCIDYVVGSPYAVISYFYISLDENLFETEITLGLALFKMKKPYVSSRYKQGERVSYHINALVYYSNDRQIWFETENKGLLNGYTLQMHLLRTDWIDKRNPVIVDALFGISTDEDRKLVKEYQDFINSLLLHYKDYKNCYKSLNEVIEKYLFKGRLYVKDLKNLLKNNEWVMYDKQELLTFKTQTDVRFSDCTIYLNANIEDEEQNLISVTQNILYVEKYTTIRYVFEFKYKTFTYDFEENPYFLTWICNKVNKRSLKAIESKIMNYNKQNPSSESIVIDSYTVAEDIYRFIRFYLNMNVEKLLLHDFKIKIKETDDSLNKDEFERVKIPYSAINRGIRTGNLLSINRDMIDKALKKYAKYKMIGRNLKELYVDISTEWVLRDLSFICE